MTTVATRTGSTDELVQWVTCRLSDEMYGIDVMLVQEVLRVTDIAPVPGAPHYVLGIINLRGNVVTVIDARVRLGLPGSELTDSARIVIIKREKHVVGILVDCVAEVVDLRMSEVGAAPTVGSDEGAGYIQGVASHEDKLLILIDLHAMLTDEGWEDLSGH